MPIKSFSPDLIVFPFLNPEKDIDAERVRKILRKVHVIVVGPGLGKEHHCLNGAFSILKLAKEFSIPLVIDGVRLIMTAKLDIRTLSRPSY